MALTAEEYNSRQIIREAETALRKLTYTDLSQLVESLRYDSPRTFRMLKGIFDIDKGR